MLKGGFEDFFGILHNDMGGASAPPNPPGGGGCALPRPPAFLYKKTENALSPLSALLNPLSRVFLESYTMTWGRGSAPPFM